MFHDFRHNSKWVPSTNVKKLGPVTYHVDLGGGNILKCHIDQLRQHMVHVPLPDTPNEATENSTVEDNFQYPETAEHTRTRASCGGSAASSRSLPTESSTS